MYLKEKRKRKRQEKENTICFFKVRQKEQKESSDCCVLRQSSNVEAQSELFDVVSVCGCRVCCDGRRGAHEQHREEDAPHDADERRAQ